jgi:Bacterial regulatory helix-turn-helix protein, lysR family
MRLRHIEVFNAVMLTGSVSSAARLINVTQPAVSRMPSCSSGLRCFSAAKAA